MKEKKRTKLAYTVYDNRELSWLKFNLRVLEEAEDHTNPLGERLSFASIFQSNLDEFFMVRCGSLYDQMQVSKNIRDSKTNMTCEEQLNAIFEQVKLLTQRKDATYAQLKRELKDTGIHICSYTELDKSELRFLDAYFKREVLPLLSPQVVGKKQPFPFLKNKDIYAVVVLEKKKHEKLGIIPCSVDVLPRMIPLSRKHDRYLLMEELIFHYIPFIFEHYDVKSRSLIRIIRNADIDPDEDLYNDDDDFRQIMEQMVIRRRKLCPIKLEYSHLMDISVLEKLGKHLKLKKRHMFHSDSPLDISFVSEIQNLLRSRRNLFYSKMTPKISPDLDLKKSMIAQIEEKDRFLFFPYDSITPFLTFLNEAAEDPSVVSIKMTLYRVASDSKVIDALIKAAQNGKEVVVIVELRARFDEKNNIDWSRQLEDAGCHVMYGLDELKVHSKLCLVTKRKDSHISYVTQIGTGNYNEKTSRFYTDFSLMTSHQGIGEEANEIFQSLCMGQVMTETSHLFVAPKCMRTKILDKMDEQIALARDGKPAYIGAKMNALTDKRIIDKLIEASRAGVTVELIVRGSCCLVAGIPGITDHISVRSIVGRYLEHSRIYIFGTDDVYISSADFMTRNMLHRVEVAVPIYDEAIKERILHIFRTLMSDNVKARTQMPDGHYRIQFSKENHLNAQKYFETNE